MKLINLNKLIFFFLFVMSITFGQIIDESDFHNVKKGFYFVNGQQEALLQTNNFKIRIWGEVKNPGVYIVPLYASLIDIIAISGGPNSEADLSKIKIINQPSGNLSNKSEFENIINLEYFLQKGKFRVVPKLGNDTIIIVPRNRRTRFFDSLPKVVNVLNITSLIIILVTWINKR